MSEADLKCDDCGRFMNPEAVGSSMAERYDMVAMCADYIHMRCPRCTDRLGPVQSNAQPSNGDMSPYQTHVRRERRRHE